MIKRKPTEVPASLKTIDVKAILRRRGIYDAVLVNKELKNSLIPVARKFIQSRHKVKAAPPTVTRHDQFSNEEVMAYWEKQIHIVEILEEKFDKKVQQFIGKVVGDFLAHLESEVATTKSVAKLKDFFDDNEDGLKAEAQLDFTPLLTDVAVLAGQEAYDLIHSKDVYTAMDIRKQIAANVEKFTGSMLETDRQTLINIISDGLTGGQSVPEIRNQITETFSSIQKTQAQRITRTEVLRASNQASIDAYTQSGVVEGLQWLTAGAVDECADYEGDVISLDGSFYGADSEFQDGYPPLHPNCRCVVLPVLLGEKSYNVSINKAMSQHIKELESQIDKRTKEFKLLKEQRIDDELYVKALEKHLGVSDE